MENITNSLFRDPPGKYRLSSFWTTLTELKTSQPVREGFRRREKQQNARRTTEINVTNNALIRPII